MTVNQFADRIINYYKKLNGSVPSGMVVYYVEQLLREHNDDTKCNKEDSEGVGFSSAEAEGKIKGLL